jgi:two-component system chemotaxis response regulator CheY
MPHAILAAWCVAPFLLVMAMLQIRILVADPSKGLLRYMGQVFDSFSFDGRYIKQAQTPEDALKLARSLKPDLLITDWFDNEPLTGLALYSAARGLNPLCQLGLLRTGVEPQHTAAAEEAGALFLLQKPCTSAQLLAALGQALKDLSHKNPTVNTPAKDDAAIAAQHLSALKRAAQMAPLKPGDQVLHQGRRDTVRNAILRRGEMVVQLEGFAELVPVEELQRA